MDKWRVFVDLWLVFADLWLVFSDLWLVFFESLLSVAAICGQMLHFSFYFRGLMLHFRGLMLHFRTYGWFFLKVPSNLKKHKKTWWLPMPLLLFVVRGIEPPPSAATLPTHSSYLVRPSSLFSLSLLSLILQAAVKAVSHFFTSSPRLPTVGQLFFLSLIIHQQYFTTCSL